MTRNKERSLFNYKRNHFRDNASTSILEVFSNFIFSSAFASTQTLYIIAAIALFTFYSFTRKKSQGLNEVNLFPVATY